MTFKIATQDFEAHHRILRKELEAAAVRVIASGQYISGAEVAAFEKEAAAAAGIEHAVAVSSGTDAILALLMALDVGPGDEVVTTPFSFFATVGAIARLGARPVFADVDEATCNLDPELAAAKIGPKTKAVLTVHLFGRMARTEPLEAACAAAGVPLLEDAAQAIGARAGSATGRRVGSVGRAATLSFFPSKNLGGLGDGGMVITSDGALAEKLRVLRSHGGKPKYHHVLLGGNFRLDELQAALLRVKLPHLPRWTALRQMLAARYRKGLADVPVTLPPEDAGCVWNQFVVRIPDGRRDQVAKTLADQGIATAIYYPSPLHLQPCFGTLGEKPGSYPRAEAACRDVLALPLYPELPTESVQAVCTALARALA